MAGQDQPEGQDGPSPSPSLASLAHALTAFSSHFRKPSDSASRPQAQAQTAPRQRSCDLQLPTAQWELAPWTRDEFPSFPAEQIEAIWKGEGEDEREVRMCVGRAVEEMELNWNLDPRLLGARSDSNRGNAAIISLLSRLALAASSASPASAAARAAAAQANDGSGNTAAAGEAAVQASRGKHAAPHAQAERPPRTWERHDLLRAIERQDHETILEIRSANFDLLLDAAPGSSGGGYTPASSASAGAAASSSQHQLTPLGYAISLGPRWQGTAIVLTGALSKFVNSLPDPEDLVVPDVVSGGPSSSSAARGRRRLRLEYDPHTMSRLRKVRSNLKLAVDRSLALDQTALLASYVQVLFMSEGTPFILDSVASLRTSLRAVLGPQRRSTAVGEIIAPAREESDPVREAKGMVGQFVNQGLRKRERVAAVGDLVDNAAGDLVLMALWDLIRIPAPHSHSHSHGGAQGGALSGAHGGHEPGADTDEALDLDPDLHDPLPPYFFARDDRITQAFLQRVEALARWVEEGETVRPSQGQGSFGPSQESLGRGTSKKTRTGELRAGLRKSPFLRKALEVVAALRGEASSSSSASHGHGGGGSGGGGGGGGGRGGGREGEEEGGAAVGSASAGTGGGKGNGRKNGERTRLRLESGERLALLEGCLK